jgi:hypothetical protein
MSTRRISPVNLTPQQKRICEQVLNAFETGSAAGDYANISIYADGPHDMRQITYGRSQTTEYGKLRALVKAYVAAGGTYSGQLAPYLDKIGNVPLVEDASFKKLLRDAGRQDPIMRTVQDAFFDQAYFQPAMAWAKQEGFKQALSALVIYDSYIHSGRILRLIRSQFPEVPPSQGGDEKKWTTGYVNARHNWLANHSRKILQNTVYRTKCFKSEVARSNWDLSQLPINANGVKIS